MKILVLIVATAVIFSIGMITHADAQYFTPRGQVYQYDENIYIIQHNGYHLLGLTDSYDEYSISESVIYGDVVNLSDDTLYYIIVRGNVYKDGTLWSGTGYNQQWTFRHNYNIEDGKPTELAISPYRASLHPGESAPFSLWPGQTGFDCYEIWIESYKYENIEENISDEVMRSDFEITRAELNDRGTLKGTVHNVSPNLIKYGFVIITEYNQDDEIFAIKGTSIGTLPPDKKKNFSLQVYTPGMPTKNILDKWFHKKPDHFEIQAWGYTDDRTQMKTTMGYAGDVIHMAESPYYPDKDLAYYMNIDEIRKQATIDVQKKPNRSFCLNDENQASTPVQSAPSKQNIPKWIKNNIEWWSVGQIDDLAFLTGIEFLVKEKIIIIEMPDKSDDDLRYESAISSEPLHQVPEWVKNNAKWWADGAINDETFISSLKFLIEEGIIKT